LLERIFANFSLNPNPNSNPNLSLNSNPNLKGRVQCFSMQVVINKCFLLNTKKKFDANPTCRFRQKRKKRAF